MKNILIVLSVLFLIISCRQGEKETSISQITTNYDTLIHRVKNNGDKDAYDELFYGFKDGSEVERTDSLMFYSKIMAEKFNYDKAYYDYLEAFGEKHEFKVDFSDLATIDISKLEKDSRIEATNWLKNMVSEKVMTQKQFDSIKK
ncbi:hypothetical protein [Flavobacterium wongokense]|uniref:hypothetical protein n=1 Tax=Flavobacterium wongokense TaxID=2910674 RepID=UPI001F2D8E22|nr:hypothetical protein [Flavobacterium sp. WG47]MCF6133462.1 hypothetical protein [Flavobacterium sp. WG47]